MVLDASAVVQLLLGLPGGEQVEERLRDISVSVHAPQLLLLEAAQVIRRVEQLGGIGAREAAMAIADLLALDITPHDHDLLLPRVWELRHNLTSFDASYVAPAEVLDAPLLTFDAHLAAAPGHLATIELLSAA